MMSILKQKQELRHNILKANRELPLHEKMKQSESVFERVEALDEFRRANTIAFFWSLPDELPTHDIVARWAATKRIVLPVVERGQMYFREYSPDCDMEQGQLGIFHPKHASPISPDQIDLIIVPGVAFDSQGGRLGRGRGYYDKFLSATIAPTIGVCMRHQMVREIPLEEHDKRVSMVVFG